MRPSHSEIALHGGDQLCQRRARHHRGRARRSRNPARHPHRPFRLALAAYAPGPLTRSADAAIGGLPDGTRWPRRDRRGAPKSALEVRSALALPSLVGFPEADSITAQVKALSDEEIPLPRACPARRKPYEDASKALDAFRKLPDEPTGNDLQTFAGKLAILKDPIPTFESAGGTRPVGRAIAAFHQKYDGTPDPGRLALYGWPRPSTRSTSWPGRLLETRISIRYDRLSGLR